MADVAVADAAVGQVIAEATAQAEVSDWDRMTPEERKADIDAIPSEPSGEQETEPAETSDERARDSAGRFTETKTPAAGDETPADDDAAQAADAATGEGDGEGHDTGADWLDAETRNFATTMGLTDEDLAGFSSREGLEHALRVIDRKAFEAAKASQAKAGDGQQQQQAQASQQQQAGDPLASLEAFALDNELGAEDAPKILEAIRSVTSELKEGRAFRLAVQQREQQQAVQSIRQRALESLHSLGHVDLFGKPGETPTKAQMANIEKAIESHFTHARGLIALGRNVAPTPAFLKSAVYAAFGEEITKHEKQQLTDKLRKQSSRRTGGPGAKHVPTPPPADETDDQRRQRLSADPEVAAAVRRFFTEGD
jgi:hypothetical protein